MGAAIARIVSSVGGGLTKTGVTPGSGGPTVYADNAGPLIAADSLGTMQPGRSDLSGTLTPPTITSTQVGDTPPAGIGPLQDPAVSVTQKSRRDFYAVHSAPGWSATNGDSSELGHFAPRADDIQRHRAKSYPPRNYWRGKRMGGRGSDKTTLIA
jgi:hypothetical protein